MENTVTITLPKKAGQNPAASKPFTKVAILKSKVFIINKKKPKVVMLKGKVKIFKGKPTNTFNTDKTKATNKAVPNPLTEIPGTTLAASITPSAFINNLKIIFIAQLYHLEWFFAIIKLEYIEYYLPLTYAPRPSCFKEGQNKFCNSGL